jgi:hypothetical protein
MCAEIYENNIKSLYLNIKSIFLINSYTVMHCYKYKL